MLLFAIFCSTLLCVTPVQTEGDVAFPAQGSPIEKPVDWRVDLLDQAFEGVSQLPDRPHIKNRTRAQAKLVTAALELDLVKQACSYADRITGWRGASAEAEIAGYLLRHGQTSRAMEYMNRAKTGLKASKNAHNEGWRLSEVRAKLAAYYLYSGDLDAAMMLQVGLETTSAAIIEVAKARIMDPEQFDEQYESALRLIGSADFEQLEAVLASSTTLYERYFDDLDRRAKVWGLIQQAWKPLPLLVRIETTETLMGVAYAEHDQDETVRWAQVAQGLVESIKWSPELEVQMLARLGGMQYLAGDAQAARQSAAAALELFQSSRKAIVDMYRGRSLRPLASTYHMMGEQGLAEKVFGMVLEEALVNPNGRPRCEDFSATLALMVEIGFKPSKGLESKILGFGESLRAPW